MSARVGVSARHGNRRRDDGGAPSARERAERSARQVSRRPSLRELEQARGKGVRNVAAPGLHVLFVGINPGLYSGAVGHHFARPGNRFWVALYQSGWTPRQLAPHEERRLLDMGIGVTNIVNRATATASELSREDLRRGAGRVRRLVRRIRPRGVVFLGMGAYRMAFARPRARWGPQPETLAGVPVWVLPNPSGLNARHPLPVLVRQFAHVRRALGVPDRREARRAPWASP